MSGKVGKVVVTVLTVLFSGLGVYVLDKWIGEPPRAQLRVDGGGGQVVSGKGAIGQNITGSHNVVTNIQNNNNISTNINNSGGNNSIIVNNGNIIAGDPTRDKSKYVKYFVDINLDKYKSDKGDLWDFFIHGGPEPYPCILTGSNVDDQICADSQSPGWPCNGTHVCSAPIMAPAADRFRIRVMERDSGEPGAFADDFVGEGDCRLNEPCRLMARARGHNSATVTIRRAG